MPLGRRHPQDAEQAQESSGTSPQKEANQLFHVFSRFLSLVLVRIRLDLHGVPHARPFIRPFLLLQQSQYFG